MDGTSTDTGEHTPQDATPVLGWYPDPGAAGDTHRRRWWDGTAWGPAEEWAHGRWTSVAPAGTAPGAARPRGVRRWVLVVGLAVGAAVVLALGGVVALVVWADDQLPPAVHQDFSASADPLETYVNEEAGFAFELVDGTYQIRATTPEGGSGWAPAFLDAGADRVRVSTRVVSVEPVTATSVAVGCSAGSDMGYDAWFGPDGGEIDRFDLTTEKGDVVPIEQADPVLPPAPFTVTVTCTQEGDGSAVVEAAVDGLVVLRGRDRKGLGPFDGAALTVDSTVRSTVRFDDLSMVPSTP